MSRVVRNTIPMDMEAFANYMSLYKNLLCASSVLFDNDLVCAFVQNEIKREFIENRGSRNPMVNYVSFQKGTAILTTMVHLIEERHAEEIKKQTPKSTKTVQGAKKKSKGATKVLTNPTDYETKE